MAKQSPIIEDFYRDVTAFGSLIFSIVLIALPLAFKEYRLATQLALIFALSYAITFPIKFFFFKQRPNKQRHSNIFERVEASSFPSLHSMRALGYAIPLLAFNQNPLFIILIILITTGILLTRIATKKHYPIDVLAGAIIGAILGALITLYPVADYLLTLLAL